MKPKIVLIGGGGHCKSCIDVIEQQGRYQVAGIVDLKDKLHQQVLGYEVFATDEDLPELVKQYRHFLITIGQIKSPAKRITLFEKVKDLGGHLPTVISPHAYVSPHAHVAEGSIVMHHAVLNVEVSVGRNCIINTRALIEHEAAVADHCHIATGAIVNGSCRIGEGTLVGSNAVVRESIEVGDYALIGSNMKIDKDVPPQTVVR